jgi:4-hydroxy-tetrahydrodipicolinate reductase
MSIRVVVTGITGKMGAEIANAVLCDPQLQLICGVSRTYTDDYVTTHHFNSHHKTRCYHHLSEALADMDADVLVDFTHPDQFLENIETALYRGLHVVTGTTGVPLSSLDKAGRLALSVERAVIFAPNFALGSVIMMHAVKLASQHLNQVEIIEMHHPEKVDAPSGTAIQTAAVISSAHNGQGKVNPGAAYDPEWYKNPAEPSDARGFDASGIKIHSIRLPGLVAHQEVIFGGYDETLTIKHDALSRKCYMPGIMLSIKEVVKRKGLIVGLESILGLDS